MLNPIFAAPPARPLARPDRAPLVAVAALVLITLAAFLGGQPAQDRDHARPGPEAQRVLEDWRGNSAHIPAEAARPVRAIPVH